MQPSSSTRATIVSAENQNGATIVKATFFFCHYYIVWESNNAGEARGQSWNESLKSRWIPGGSCGYTSGTKRKHFAALSSPRPCWRWLQLQPSCGSPQWDGNAKINPWSGWCANSRVQTPTEHAALLDIYIEVPSHIALRNTHTALSIRHAVLSLTSVLATWPKKTKAWPKSERTLRWRHNDHDGVSNHQPRGCLLNCLFTRRSKKTSKLRVTGLCAGNSPGPLKSPHKGPVTRKMLPFDDVIMILTYINDTGITYILFGYDVYFSREGKVKWYLYGMHSVLYFEWNRSFERDRINKKKSR